ncbi:MAG TPA: hypothetical protein VK806_05545, partial [Bacteroidia bacterium]|nr:hypothetical protein [Bacteroidia bacterium]
YSYRQEKTWNRKNILLYCLLFAIGATISVFSMLPPTDVHLYQQVAADNFISAERISKTLSFLFKGLYPLPDLASHYFWNSNFIITHCKILSVIFTPLLFIIPFILFYNKPYSLVAFYIPVFLIMAFIYKFELFTGVHYMGHAFILLMVSLWLASSVQNTNRSITPATWILKLGRLTTFCYTPFLVSVMACQLIAGVYAFSMDYTYPFSEGKEVAGYIKSHSDNNSLLITAPFYAGPPIAVYTNQKFFYPDDNALGTFTVWNTNPIDGNEAWNRIEHVMGTTTAKSIVISIAYSGDTLKALQQHILALGNPYYIKEVKEFNQGIVRGENYLVYVIEKKNK